MEPMGRPPKLATCKTQQCKTLALRGSTADVLCTLHLQVYDDSMLLLLLMGPAPTTASATMSTKVIRTCSPPAAAPAQSSAARSPAR